MKFFARPPTTQQAKSAPAKSGGGKKPMPPTPAKPLLTLDQWLDVLGIGLLLLALVSVLAILTPNKGALSSILGVYSSLFGLGQYIAPLLLGFIGVFLIVRRFGSKFPRLRLGAVIGVVMAFVCLLVTLHAIGTITQNGDALAAAGEGGGSVGWGILHTLDESVGKFGAAILMLIGWLVAFMLMSNVTMAQVVAWAQQMIAGLGGARGPSDDVITPPWDKPEGGDLKINWNRSKKKVDEARKKNAAPEVEPELEINLPEARPIGANAAAMLGVPVAPDKPLVINQPGHKRNQANPNAPTANKLPPARVIGSGNEIRDSRLEIQGSAQSPISNLQSQPPQISSRLAIERNWAMPEVEKVLEPGKDSSMQEADIRKRAKTIEDTLDSFGVPGRITEVNRGPTITQFGVEPGFVAMKNGKQVKVKVSRIAALADDLALALAAPRIRIEAPVPGRNIVGIEVPNGETSIVSLRDVMESEEFDSLQRKTKLRLGLGQDVSGHPVVADLTTMPHLLIAGTTGSGKSVCVNAIITALMCYNSPQDLRFIMVDPKRVELTGYNGIPHLISPVVVDVEKVTGVLQWVTREMDMRYRTFAKYGARNIVDFNGKAAEAKSSDGTAHRREQRAEGGSSLSAQSSELVKLPYIVVIVDELADLMMLAPDETEKTLVRLAQMARATGIHLIIATQRPSVDVVTGLIKANFPARIAFTVATSIDSRVIIDSPGAEKLLGRGDMLVITPEAPIPMRAQGCWLSNPEIEKVVRHWRRQLGDGGAGGGSAELNTNGVDPITASMNAPSIPMQGTLEGDLKAAPIAPQSGDPFAPANTWDEARALARAASEDDSGDKLFNDAVATVRMNGKASISLLQRRLRIGYTRSARLIEEMESKGIIGPQVPGSQFREVLNNALTPPGGLASNDDEETMTM
jgi:S-DNA-T family DNA segregation ATPase FtsK/SpoIIIE